METARAVTLLDRWLAYQHRWPGRKTEIRGVIFGAEDFAQSTGITRTPSMIELLHARQQVVLAAKCFGLNVIDLVLVHRDYN